jgi:hypothetical protein
VTSGADLVADMSPEQLNGNVIANGALQAGSWRSYRSPVTVTPSSEARCDGRRTRCGQTGVQPVETTAADLTAAVLQSFLDAVEPDRRGTVTSVRPLSGGYSRETAIAEVCRTVSRRDWFCAVIPLPGPASS